jgi:hypothetical protein
MMNVQHIFHAGHEGGVGVRRGETHCRFSVSGAPAPLLELLDAVYAAI